MTLQFQKKIDTIPSDIRHSVAEKALAEAEQRRRDAYMLLDNMNDYGASRDRLIEELRFNLGYDEAEAKTVYRDWMKVQ